MVKLIIDTDPGVDDILAIVLALFTPHVDLKLISLCFGNCDTDNSLRNILTLFHVLALEQKHRNASTPLVHSRPTISVGLKTALDGSQLDATDFHGADGLGNVHITAPHYTAPPAWVNLFAQDSNSASSDELPFVVSKRPAYLDMLDILKTEPTDTVVIVAIGPLMNLAKAAELDPATFSRAKHVVSMGGALSVPGNVTPFAEFNIFSDVLAASKVYNMTGNIHENPDTDTRATVPLTILPLDLTETQKMAATDFDRVLGDDTPASPLLDWSRVWIRATFDTFRRITGYDALSPAQQQAAPLGIQMHDPLAVWYAVTAFQEEPHNSADWLVDEARDVRVETTGEWTRGMTILDQRGKPKRAGATHNDHGIWLTKGYGNRVNVVRATPLRHGDADSSDPRLRFGRLVLQTMYNLPSDFFGA